MGARRLLARFATVFGLAFVTSGVVTYVWNSLGHGEARPDWGTMFVLAMAAGAGVTGAGAGRSRQQ